MKAIQTQMAKMGNASVRSSCLTKKTTANAGQNQQMQSSFFSIYKFD
jgi:hypothetical protein